MDASTVAGSWRQASMAAGEIVTMLRQGGISLSDQQEQAVTFRIHGLICDVQETRKTPFRFKRHQERLAAALDFIQAYFAQYGIGPSYREICAAIGISSTSTVKALVDELCDQGRIQIRPIGHRAIMLPKEPQTA